MIESGERKEKRLLGGGAFFLYRIPTPKKRIVQFPKKSFFVYLPVLMKGMEKSTASSRWAVILRSRTAKSAF